jgi:hypothetical protein
MRKASPDRILEIAALTLLLATFIPILAGGQERIPIHYNPRGEVDGWGGRAMLWLFPAIGAALFAVLTVATRLKAVKARMLRWANVFLMAMFCGLSFASGFGLTRLSPYVVGVPVLAAVVCILLSSEPKKQ